MQPLDSTEFDLIDAQTTRAEKLWRWLPFPGWWISQRLWLRRTQPIRDRLLTQLAARPASTMEEWQPEQQVLAAKVCDIAQKVMGWPTANFIPTDPYRVVFWCFEDALDLQTAMLDITGATGVQIPEEKIRWAIDKTLGDFIAELDEARGVPTTDQEFP